MAVDKKFFVDINLQGNALNNATIGSNSDMTKGGSFRFDGTRLEYYNGSSVQSVANMSDISAVTGGLIFQEGYDAATNTPDIADGNALKGYFWVVTVAGSFLGTSVQVGDSIIAKVDAAGASIGDWLILQGNIVTATDEVEGIVRLATQEEVDGGAEGGAVVLTPATLQSKIDSQIAPVIDSKLPFSGGTMSGSIDLDGNSITNLSNPTYSNDAARKKYVDDAASTAQSNAESFATTAADNAQAAAEATASADATAKANAAQAAAESYADGLAVNYDAAGSAATAETNAKAYADSLAPNYDAAGSAATAETNAKAYADSLAPNYDAAGSAAQALTDANGYTDSAISQEVTDRNSAIATAKGEAIADSNSYTDGAIAQEVIDRDAAIASATVNAKDYTDTQIAAQSFTNSYVAADWVSIPGFGYRLNVVHGLNSTAPKVTTIVQSMGNVEFFWAVTDTNEIAILSNSIPSNDTLVGVSK